MVQADVENAFVHRIPASLLDVLLQSPQSLLRLLQNIIRLADSESQPVLGEMRVVIGEELRWRNGCNTKLLDAEPRKLEVARSAGDVRRERVVGWKLHLGQVDEDEVAAFRLRVL